MICPMTAPELVLLSAPAEVDALLLYTCSVVVISWKTVHSRPQSVNQQQPQARM